MNKSFNNIFTIIFYNLYTINFRNGPKGLPKRLVEGLCNNDFYER